MAERLAAQYDLGVATRGVSSLSLADPWPAERPPAAGKADFAGASASSFSGPGLLAAAKSGSGMLGAVAARLGKVGSDPARRGGTADVKVEPGAAEFGGRVKVSIAASPAAEGFFNAFLDAMGEASHQAADLLSLDDFVDDLQPGEKKPKPDKRNSIAEWYGVEKRASIADWYGPAPEDTADAGDSAVEIRRESFSGDAVVFSMSNAASRRSSVATEGCEGTTFYAMSEAADSSRAATPA